MSHSIKVLADETKSNQVHILKDDKGADIMDKAGNVSTLVISITYQAEAISALPMQPLTRETVAPIAIANQAAAAPGADDEKLARWSCLMSVGRKQLAVAV